VLPACPTSVFGCQAQKAGPSRYRFEARRCGASYVKTSAGWAPGLPHKLWPACDADRFGSGFLSGWIVLAPCMSPQKEALCCGANWTVAEFGAV